MIRNQFSNLFATSGHFYLKTKKFLSSKKVFIKGKWYTMIQNENKGIKRSKPDDSGSDTQQIPVKEVFFENL